MYMRICNLFIVIFFVASCGGGGGGGSPAVPFAIKLAYVSLPINAVPKKILDVFLNENSWAQFDPEVGYILGNHMPHDGIDNSYTISTSTKDGKRTNRIYAERPCSCLLYTSDAADE